MLASRYFALAALLATCFVSTAQAQFVGPYAPGNWTFNANGGDGSVNTSGAPSSIFMQGADNGIGSNNTDFTVPTAGNGTVTFTWNYQTFDTDGPFFDTFGYTINGAYTQLTNDGGADSQSGTTTTTVALNWGNPALTTTPGDGGTIDFGNVLVGTTSSEILTATNTGNLARDTFGFRINSTDTILGPAEVTISNFNGPTAGPTLLSGAFGNATGEFSLASPAGFGPLAPGNSANGAYQYAPTAIGGDASSATVTSNGGTSTVNLTGNGVAPVQDTSQTGAGLVRVGTSGTASVGIENVGNGNTNTQGIGAGSNLNGSIAGLSGEFSGPGGAFSLPDGTSTSYSYTYTPTARGADAVGVPVSYSNGSSDGTNSSQTVIATLTGQGVGPVYASSPGTPAPNNPASTTMLTFDNVDVVLGPTETSTSLTIANVTPDGDLGQLTDLSLLGAMITGADGTQFDIDFTPTVLAAGDDVTFDLTFTVDPFALNGLKEALLEIKTDQNAPFGQLGDSFFYQLKGVQTPEPASVLLWSMIGAGAYFCRRRRQSTLAA